MQRSALHIVRLAGYMTTSQPLPTFKHLPPDSLLKSVKNINPIFTKEMVKMKELLYVLRSLELLFQIKASQVIYILKYIPILWGRSILMILTKAQWSTTITES